MREFTDAVPDITPHELLERRASTKPPLLVDVREPWEWETARIDGAELVPLSTFTRDWGQLPRDRDIVVYCHHGVRSLAAAQFLLAQGLTAVANLAGGIDRYATEVDPRIPRY